VKVLQQAKSNSFSGNAFFIFLIRFFPSLANALVIILFSRNLSTPAYGSYQNFWIQLFVLNTLACLGFQSFIITYPHRFVAGIFKKLTGSHYLLLALWIVVCAAIFAGIQYAYNAISPVIPFLFLLAYALSVIAESILLSFRRFKILLGVNVAHTAVFILLHVYHLYEGWSFSMLFMALLLLAVARLLLLAVPAARAVKAEPSGHIDTAEMRKARNLWVHIGIYDVSQMLFKWIDKFIISLLLAGQLSAIYFNGSVDIPFLPLLLGAAGSAALMQLAQVQGGNEKEQALHLINHSSRLLSSIVFPVFWFLCCYRTELFTVLLSDTYLPSVPIFVASILALPLRAYSFTTLLQNRHKGRIINIGAILDLLLACALMYPLYLLMGLPGVALSFVISSYLQAAYYLYHTATVLQVKIVKLVPFANLLVKLIVFAFLFIVIHYLSAIYFTPQIVLFSGVLLAMLMAAITLLVEYRVARK